jgi:N-formylglutamate amidohydrolase
MRLVPIGGLEDEPRARASKQLPFHSTLEDEVTRIHALMKIKAMSDYHSHVGSETRARANMNPVFFVHWSQERNGKKEGYQSLVS